MEREGECPRSEDRIDRQDVPNSLIYRDEMVEIRRPVKDSFTPTARFSEGDSSPDSSADWDRGLF